MGAIWQNLDKDEVRKRVGDRVRWLRNQHHMTLEQLAEAVTEASGGAIRWTDRTVTNIQTGNGSRVLQIEDAIALAMVFQCSIDELILGKPGKKIIPRRGRPRLGPPIPSDADLDELTLEAMGRSERLPTSVAGPGQKARLEALAARAQASVAALMRVTTEIGLRALEGIKSDEEIGQLVRRVHEGTDLPTSPG